MSQKKAGFTLVELLVTLTILGILATIGLGQYHTSQAKARDAQRKADLDNIARALEMYYNDHQSYPLSEDGKIKVGSTTIEWGESFEDASSIYMKKLPQDPLSDQSYCYVSDGGYFKLYAKLENTHDAEYHSGYSCNGDDGYSYGIASANETP